MVWSLAGKVDGTVACVIRSSVQYSDSLYRLGQCSSGVAGLWYVAGFRGLWLWLEYGFLVKMSCWNGWMCS